MRRTILPDNLTKEQRQLNRSFIILALCLILMTILQVAKGIGAFYLNILVNITTLIVLVILIKRHFMFIFSFITMIVKVLFDIYVNYLLPNDVANRKSIITFYNIIFINLVIIICMLSMICCAKKNNAIIGTIAIVVLSITLILLFLAKSASEMAFDDLYNNNEYYTSEEGIIPDSLKPLADNEVTDSDIFSVMKLSKVLFAPDDLAKDLTKDSPLYKALKRTYDAMKFYAITYLQYILVKFFTCVAIVSLAFSYINVEADYSKKAAALLKNEGKPGKKTRRTILNILSEIVGTLMLFISIITFSVGFDMMKKYDAVMQGKARITVLEGMTTGAAFKYILVAYVFAFVIFTIAAFFIIFPIIRNARRKRIIREYGNQGD